MTVRNEEHQRTERKSKCLDDSQKKNQRNREEEQSHDSFSGRTEQEEEEVRRKASYLNDSQAKRLLQSHVGEDTMSGQGQAVNIRDVLLGVPLGVGHAAIQVMVVYQLQDLSEHLGTSSSHAVYQLPVALHMIL